MDKFDFKRIIPHLVAVITFILISVIYFYPQLEGKKIRSGDTMVYKGAAQEAKAFKEQTGETTLWTNSMFGGMPTYQINSPSKNNVFHTLKIAMYSGFDRPIGYFVFGSITAYLMLLIFGINPWLSIFGALGFSFMTNHMVLYEAGHMSKIIAIMSSPLIIAGLWALFRKRFLVGSLAFVVGLGINVSVNHYQMTYYLAILLGIYFVMEAVHLVKSGELATLGKIIGICVACSVIAVGGSASRFLPTLEYAEDTMRGAPILAKSGSPQSASETEGLDFNYAMNWSNGTIDLFSSFIPGVAGGSNLPGDKVTSKSAFAKGVRALGSSTDRAPLYWGGLPATSGPVYFGAIFFFLIFLASFYIKGPIKWWTLIAIVLTLLLSMGKNLEVFNRLIFDYFPFYNKFRTPNSVLSVTAAVIPILGLFGLQHMIDHKAKPSSIKSNLVRPLLISTGLMSAMCLFFAFIGPSFFDFSTAGDSRYAQAGLDKALLVDRKALMRSDSIRSLVLVVLMAGTIYAYLKDKIPTVALIAGFGVLVLFDQIGVSRRYLDSDSFLNARQVAADFQPRPVDTQILSDKDPNFRVFDQTIDPWNSSRTSYFHKTVGGMHAAKLQRIQDLFERHISKGNQRVFNMLNTKYFIMPGENNAPPQARLNTAALGNAWFVNSIKLVNNANEEIDALSSFDPAGEAIVHQEFQNYIGGLTPTKNGTIKLLDYKPNSLSYESSTNSEQLAVFSEMWYGPDKGWQAYLDGEKVDHIRANYGLRAMKIPAGNHRINFIFDPSVYRLGSMISLISSIIFVLAAAGMLWLLFKRGRIPGVQNEVDRSQPVVVNENVDIAKVKNKTLTPTKSTKKGKKRKSKKKDK